jgi:hypothetical protein
MNEIQHLAKPKDGPAPRWFHLAVAASMVISAVSALIATIHTGRTMTALVEQNAKLVRAGSTPVLEFTHGNVSDDGEAALGFFVSNQGSGMARIVWFEMRLDNKPMRNMRDVARVLGTDFDAMPNISSKLKVATSSVAGRTLSPGTDVTLVAWPRPPKDEILLTKLWNDLNQARFQRIEVEACFCSVFQECWISKLTGDVPLPSPDCPTQKRVSLQG